jgi:hypothetical protein
MGGAPGGAPQGGQGPDPAMLMALLAQKGKRGGKRMRSRTKARKTKSRRRRR